MPGGLVNSHRGIVVDTTHDGGSVDVTWDDGRRLTRSADALYENHLALGYAVTAHKSQGATNDRAILAAAFVGLT
jgi:ATP-dependent exoDNAse (exonuclease V) alpha subunit